LVHHKNTTRASSKAEVNSHGDLPMQASELNARR